MTNEEQSKAARANTRQGQLPPSMTWLKRLASTDDVGWHGNEVKTRACPRSADGAREMIREEKTRPASASASPSKTDAKKPGSKALRTRLGEILGRLRVRRGGENLAGKIGMTSNASHKAARSHQTPPRPTPAPPHDTPPRPGPCAKNLGDCRLGRA
jgi:hypothetical protein